MSVERARSDIIKAFPELAVQTVSLLGSGVDSDAYLVNDTWVFRFPRRLAASVAVDREIALLPRLAERLPVSVPHFEYVGEQAESELLFVGYRLIPGEPLTPELFESLSHEAQERVFTTLARFLDVVHRFSVETALDAGVQYLSTREMVGTVWRAARKHALAQLSWRDGRLLESLIDRFLADARNFSVTPCLLYADFAPEHILYDCTVDRISGIIDWGDMAIGDPDYDLMYLYQDYGPDFVRRLLLHTRHPDPARLFKKLRAFCAYDYLMHFAANSITEPDEDTAAALNEAVDGLRQMARET